MQVCERHGVNGGWCAQSSFDAADERPDGRLALHCSLGSQSEHRRGAILGFSRPGTEQFAPNRQAPVWSFANATTNLFGTKLAIGHEAPTVHWS